MAGIYIHIPFCRRKCRYCDFYSVASPGRMSPLLDALHRELELRRGEATEPVRTLYFGGGTPTVYAPEALQGLIDRVRALYDTDFEEITVEANPDDLTDDYLARLKQTGVDRLSIGIQSFHDAHTRLFNRRHTGQEGIEAVRRAKRHGFENLTVDLIYGVPGMSEAEWESNLLTFIELNVPHLSAYHLTIEPRTRFGRWAEQGKIAAVAEEVSARHYEILERQLFAAGYDHYEISNFARPGYHARHNSRYWDGTPYIGIGPAAHSFGGDVRRWNVADIQAYMNDLETGDYFETEHLSAADCFNETLLTALRTARGVEWGRLRAAFGDARVAALRTAAHKWLETGVLIDDGTALRIPTSHFLISDGVIGDLFV